MYFIRDRVDNRENNIECVFIRRTARRREILICFIRFYFCFRKQTTVVTAGMARETWSFPDALCASSPESCLAVEVIISTGNDIPANTVSMTPTNYYRTMSGNTCVLSAFNAPHKSLVQSRTYRRGFIVNMWTFYNTRLFVVHCVHAYFILYSCIKNAIFSMSRSCFNHYLNLT